MNPKIQNLSEKIDSYLGRWSNLERSGEFSKARTLKRMIEVSNLMQNPQSTFRDVITVTGSKGKTSTASMIAGLLAADGSSVGLYTSPHVEDWSERIQVNNRPIDLSVVCQIIDDLSMPEVDARLNQIQPTYFEITTLIAFVCFKKLGIKTIVLEVGIGGAYDATNICDANVCAFTPIGMEHQKILGDSLAEIAKEKSGIIKKESRVVMAKQAPEAENVLTNACLLITGRMPHGDLGSYRIVRENSIETQVKIHGENVDRVFCLPFTGRHQIDNFMLAQNCVAQLRGGSWLGSFDNGELMKKVQLKGRCEVVSVKPVIVIDGAHDKLSSRALRSLLDGMKAEKITLVFGIFRDKNIRDWFDGFGLKGISQCIATSCNHERGLRADELNLQLHEVGIQSVCNPKIRDVLDHLWKNSSANDFIVIAGSMYLAGLARTYFKSKEHMEFI